MKLDFAEITKINLNPGDVLVVKLQGDHYTEDDIHSLKASFDVVFPHNKVFVTTLPQGFDMKFEVIAPAKKPGLCPDPISYCFDCSCGKKEASETLNEEGI